MQNKDTRFKIGDIVTLEVPSAASNTYIVQGYLEGSHGKIILTHPTLEGVGLIREEGEVNSVQAQLRNPTENCLDFVQSNKNLLGYNEGIQLQALKLFHVVNKMFSPKQLQELSSLTGIIANIVCNHDIKKAMELVRSNEALLDDFNLMWYTNLEGFFTGKERVLSKSQRNSIFNITGFVLAQKQN